MKFHPPHEILPQREMFMYHNTFKYCYMYTRFKSRAKIDKKTTSSECAILSTKHGGYEIAKIYVYISSKIVKLQKLKKLQKVQKLGKLQKVQKLQKL